MRFESVDCGFVIVHGLGKVFVGQRGNRNVPRQLRRRWRGCERQHATFVFNFFGFLFVGGARLSFYGDSQSFSPRERLQYCFDFSGRLGFGVVGVGDFHDGEEFLQQRRKLKFGEKLA